MLCYYTTRASGLHRWEVVFRAEADTDRELRYTFLRLLSELYSKVMTDILVAVLVEVTALVERSAMLARECNGTILRIATLPDYTAFVITLAGTIARHLILTILDVLELEHAVMAILVKSSIA